MKSFFKFYEKIQNEKLLEQDQFTQVPDAGMASMQGDPNMGSAPVDPTNSGFAAPQNSGADDQQDPMGGQADDSLAQDSENEDNLSEPEGGLDFGSLFKLISKLGKYTKKLQGLEEDKGAEFEQVLNQLEQLVLSFPGADAAGHEQEQEQGQEDQGQQPRQQMPDDGNAPPPPQGQENPPSEPNTGEQIGAQSGIFPGGTYPNAGNSPAGPGGY